MGARGKARKVLGEAGEYEPTQMDAILGQLHCRALYACKVCAITDYTVYDLTVYLTV